MARARVGWLFCTVVAIASGCGDDGAPGGQPDARSQSACSFENCSGCCDGDTCVETQSDSACGAPGSACQVCSGAESCYAGTCLPVADCSNCDGCCLNGTQCVPGNTNLACGTGGAACSTCGDNQGCNPDTSACEALVCNETNCNGCCTANGQCLEFGEQDRQTCGKDGDACTGCAPQALSCTQGTCVIDQPCLSFCEDGCCTANGQCIAFGSQAPNQCGGAGAGSQMCMDCGVDTGCVAGMCVSDPTWDVRIVSAVISATKNGTEWDTTVFTNPLPDPYAGIALSGDTFLDGFTATIDNTTTPNWNHSFGNYLQSDLLAMGLAINIRDSDGGGIYETIGNCTMSITMSNLNAGTMTKATCGQYVMNVVFNFTLQ